MLELEFRAAEARDVQRLMDLAGGAPGAPVWTRTTWAQVIESASDGEQRLVLVAEHEGDAVGFGVMGMVAGEAEIESLAMSEDWQRQRVATHVCERMMEWARERGARQVMLEVRASNARAQALYRSVGFVEQGIRRGYYREPVEDAVLMARRL